MEAETKQERFGGYLKHCRLERCLDILTVSAKTKIPASLLQALEENDHERLPPEPYVKSFLRTCAQVVAADADVAVALYLSELERKANTQQKALRRQAKLGLLRKGLLAVGLVAGILLLVRFVDSFSDPLPSPSTAAPIEAAPLESAVLEAQASDRRRNEVALQKTQKLQVIAVKPTWLKVIVDSQNARTYALKSDERLELEGTDSFNLMIGDATALIVLLDDRPVTLYGSKGQVVSLKIP